MIDYFQAFDEDYIPTNKELSIQQNGIEMYQIFETNYVIKQFEKDFTNIIEGILEENYNKLKNGHHSIKGGLGYLAPVVLDQISGELQLFINKRLPDKKTGVPKLPMLPEDKLHIYKGSLHALTEMVAVQRHFTKTQSEFNVPYKYEEAKQLIDKCYLRYFEIFNIPYAPAQAEEKAQFDKYPSTLSQKGMKSSKLANSVQPMIDQSEKLGESLSKQITTGNQIEKDQLLKSQSIQINSKVPENSVLLQQNNQDQQTVEINQIQIESQEKIEPCCNKCIIF